MFSIVLAEYLAWHGVGLNRGFARVRRDTEGGLVRDRLVPRRRHEKFTLSLSLSVFDTGVDSVKMISPVTLLELRIDPILISRLKLIVLQVFSFFLSRLSFPRALLLPGKSRRN